MKWFKKNLKLISKLLIWTLIFIVLSIFYCNWRINHVSKDYIYTHIDSIPKNKVGIVLGTSKYLKNGTTNYYFKYRIDAAAKLYNKRKIEYIIVSGDNGLISYNEPMMMKKALIKAGVPDSIIYLDYAGFRTFDSMIRCKEIFQQDSFTVISQEFQNQRAVFIARKKGMHTIGYNAKDVSYRAGFKIRMREYLARVKVFIDIYLINKKPKFLGEKIDIGS